MSRLHDSAVEVAVAMPVHATFTYRVPRELGPAVSAGMRVLVPFGHRRATGYVLGPAPADERQQIKPILSVMDSRPIFPAEMIPLFRWAADYYLHPLGQVIQTALPGGLTLSETAVFALSEQARQRRKETPAVFCESALLQALAGGPLSLEGLRNRLGADFSGEALDALVAQGWVVRETRLAGGRAKSLFEARVRPLRTDADPAGFSGKKALILQMLAEAGELGVRELAGRVPGAAAHLRGLVQAGLVERFARRVFRDPFGDPIAPDAAPVLTAEQQAAVAAVAAARARGYGCFLLNGVTGSGKTEVYLRVAADTLESGRSILVLVPEIALITQTERRFRARFGEQVAVLHSGLSAGERYDQWCRILQAGARIVIGARSAVFAPLSDLGAIVVDEEHDSSYKQEGGLHYSARDLAVVRARHCGCPVILGSATPSLQSFYNVRSGKYSELRLPQRVRQRPMPEIRVVDLRTCRDLRGPGRFISAELKQALQETLAQGDQALLFLNRRGFASFPVCAACGSPLRCRDCDISLTLHQAAQLYRCHYCGFSRPAGAHCESCGSDKIRRLGLGTEKVEEAVRALFPQARIARMDRDTTARKGALVGLLKGLRERAIDVLVGTQMVAKGHDFPDITLVGIVCADLSLSFPDFRAAEQTFQLLAQVAGRAGRGDRPGRVILQTYAPEHFSIRTAREQDYEQFYRHEIEFRHSLGYPPVTRLVQLRIAGRDPQRTRAFAAEFGAECRALQASDPGLADAIRIMGPVEAALPRIAGHYRWQVLLKSPRSAMLRRFLVRLRADLPRRFSHRGVSVVVDVDPQFLM
ncbi:MAG: primosomal protein N' [Desulfobacterales bacterium]|jgi:primosomal protein N' (replication factor Y)|nr:primosomal protein N' [Desulfobacterales bacterium]